MTDSVYKDLVDLLVAGTWTNKPTIVQVLITEEPLVEYARANDASGKGCLFIMPPRGVNDSENGVRKKTLEFGFELYRFAFAGPDTGIYEFELLLTELHNVLKAANVTGFDNSGVTEWTDLSNRKRDYCYGIGTIKIKDWVA